MRVIRNGTQMALIPLWFLAVYVFVVALTPISHRLWKRFGIRSVLGMAALEEMVRGHMVADIIPTFGMINMIGGECDR